MRLLRATLAASPLLLLLPASARAQSAPAADAARLAGMTAVTGFEQPMADSLLRLLRAAGRRAERDRAGNVVVALGDTSGPRRLVACPMDEPGFVVGGLRDDGWLTLRRAPGRTPGPLFDQQLEGQRVTVWGRRGGVPAVVGVRSTHLARGRAANEAPFSVDDAYVDVGAATRAGAESLGVALLAPVALTKAPHRYGAGDSLLAAPAAGRRAACAALLRAVTDSAARGHAVVAFVVEQNLGQRGLLTVANTRGPFTETIVVDGAPGAAGAVMERADTALAARAAALGRVGVRLLPTRYAGTPAETVALADVATLADQLRRWLGGTE